jgi:DNA-binding transcriptional LysR family regulator
MSIRRLKTLVSVAQTGSFTAAAQAVFITRSAVSLQMKTLEEELGVELFDRSQRPPILTQAGQALIPKSIEIIRDYESLSAFLKDEKEISGQINIGAMYTAMTGVVPYAIKAMKDIYPNLRIQASPGNSSSFVMPVDGGLLDASVISEPSYLSQHLQFRPIAEEPLVVLTPVDCELDDPREILAAYPFIRISRSLWSGQLIDDWLASEKIAVKEEMELDGIQMIWTMVYHNLGVSIVPRRCVPAPNPVPLRQIPLGPSAKPRVIGVLTRRDSPKSQLTDVFLEQLVRVVKVHNDLEAKE